MSEMNLSLLCDRLPYVAEFIVQNGDIYKADRDNVNEGYLKLATANDWAYKARNDWLHTFCPEPQKNLKEYKSIMIDCLFEKDIEKVCVGDVLEVRLDIRKDCAEKKFALDIDIVKKLTQQPDSDIVKIKTASVVL